MKDKPADRNYSGQVRAAFVLLEQRLRQMAGLAEHDFGKDLVDKAFHLEKGRLQPVSPVPAECAGLHHLLVGLFLFYRNPIAHRPISYDEQSAWPVLHLINHALLLVTMAAERAFTLADFVGPHEGQILRRRDFRLDIDKDGEQEIVVLLEFGPSSVEKRMVNHLVPVILKKTEHGYRRIPAEGIGGSSIYGPANLATYNITGGDVPEIVVTWYRGETSLISVILRKVDNRYVLVRREITDEKEPYAGPSENAFFMHFRQTLNFVDTDGDGVMELVQTLRFDSEEVAAMGYELPNNQEDFYPCVCRFLSWDKEKERIVRREERLVLESKELPYYYTDPFKNREGG